MRCLYRFRAYFGRSGTLTGLFTSTPEEIAACIGPEIHFGEVLGKHSDVTATLEESDFEKLTDDADFVRRFEEYGCASGFDPRGYLGGDEEGS